MLVDDALHDDVEVLHAREEVAPLRQRAHELLAAERGELPETGEQLGEDVAERARVAGEVGAEERATDDREGERRHLLHHVDLVAVAPSGRVPLRLGDHLRGVGLDALAVERGLRQPPLTQVELALAREQPVAEQRPRRLQSTALHDVARVGEEDVGDDVGIAHEVDVLAREDVVRHRAVGARDRLEDLVRRLARTEQVERHAQPVRSGRPGHVLDRRGCGRRRIGSRRPSRGRACGCLATARAACRAHALSSTPSGSARHPRECSGPVNRASGTRGHGRSDTLRGWSTS